MADTDFITFPISSEPEDLAADAISYLQSVYPGWQPHDGNLDTVMIEAFAAMAADVRSLAAEVPTAIFRYFGSSLVGVAPIDATPAVTTATWTALDNAGHVVKAGTQVGIRNASGDLIVFYVQSDVVIPPGQTSTASGAVTLIAVTPGAETSGLGSIGGAVEQIEVFDWVAGITMTSPTSAGQDAESDTAYLNRLRIRLQLLTPRPILPSDFATLARDIPGVAYAIAVDGYDPNTNTFNNPRTVTVAVLDSTGAAVSAPVKVSVAAYLDAMREANFLVYVADPNITAFVVNYVISILPTFTAVDVLARVNLALSAYLNPAAWIQQYGNTPSKKVRYLELAQIINQVEGVDFIDSLTFGPNGGTIAAVDYTMTGAVPLPTIGPVTGAVA